jgi:tetratricopeptide (TPR) repeat protein
MKQLIRILLVCAWLTLQAHAQSTGGTLPGGGGRNPSQPSSQPLPDGPARPIFISGSVRLADGTPPPERVLIERNCNGQVRPEGYTDSQGNFSFLVSGQSNFVLGDASTGNLPVPGVNPNTGRMGNPAPRDLTGCEIEGKLSGFQSSTIVLTSRASFDSSNIGTIQLRRLTGKDGLSINSTTVSAPRDARNAYEKGLDNARKTKWSDAERDFLKAVQAYPRYAVAWYELGRIYRQENRLDDAAHAQNEALKSDPRFISPYAELTVLSAVQSKWEDVVLHSSKVINLTLDATSDIYFYSAVAHYNLKGIDTAEDHARRAATLDPQHKNPRINHLLGVILAQKRKYAEASGNLQLYLKLAPNAPEAAAINQMLGEIEKGQAGGKSNVTVP